MKKIIFTFLIFLSISLFAGDINYSVALDLAFPVGNFKDFSSPGAGISAKGHYQIIENIQITGSVGYTYFLGTGLEIFGLKWDYNYSMIPLLGGANWFVIPNQQNLYLSSEIGITFAKISMEFKGFTDEDSEKSSKTETKFTFAPSIGYLFNHKLDLNLGFRYIEEDLNYVNLKLSYSF